jgi:bloom syndrome protein
MFKRKKKARPGGKKRVKKPEESSSEESSRESDSSSSSGSETDDVDDGKEWAKKVDGDLRQYIVTKECRNLVNDTYFDNPPRTAGKFCNFTFLNESLIGCFELAPDGCDNCQQPSTTVDIINGSRPTTPVSHVNYSNHSTPSKSPNASGKRPMASIDNPTMPSGPATRRGDHLKTVRQALECWRYKMHYSRGPTSFTAAGFLPDKALTTLASNARIKTVDDMVNMIQPPWIYTSKHGEEVLDLLSKLDRAEKVDREQAKLAKRELRKKVTLERQNENKQQKMLERAQARHPKMTTPQHVLDGSSTFNVLQVSV